MFFAGVSITTHSAQAKANLLMNYPAMPRENQQSSNDFARRYHEPLRVGFTRATRKNPCPICGAKKYCQVTRDNRLAHCMKESSGAIKQARDGGYLHLLGHDLSCIAATATNLRSANLAVPHRQPMPTPLAPIEIRDAAYRKLIELSPAWNYEHELVTAQPDGLLARGLKAEDISCFGAFPTSVVERDVLAEVISLFLARSFAHHVAEINLSACIGVPGFWQHPRGRIKLGKDYDFKHPALIIPYRDSCGLIQACQLRFAGGRGGYHWLSTSEDRLEEEPLGTPSGAPLHWTFINDEKAKADSLPILVTEGAMKAEVFVRLRPPMRAIATAGVGVAHSDIIAATSGQEVIIAFDSDHRQKREVCRQLARLIAGRAQGARVTGSSVSTSVVVWEGAKGVDDAVLANLHLRVVGVAEWFQNLTKESAEEVSDVWQNYGFAPNSEDSPHDNQEKDA